jgi:hypothetical protein
MSSPQVHLHSASFFIPAQAVHGGAAKQLEAKEEPDENHLHGTAHRFSCARCLRSMSTFLGNQKISVGHPTLAEAFPSR